MLCLMVLIRQPDEGGYSNLSIVTNCMLFDVSIITLRLFKRSNCVTFAEIT